MAAINCIKMELHWHELNIFRGLNYW